MNQLNTPSDAMRFESFKTIVVNALAANAAVQVGLCRITRDNFKDILNLNEVFDLVLVGAPNEEIGAAFERTFLESLNSFSNELTEEADA